jgi:hypothetical protein
MAHVSVHFRSPFIELLEEQAMHAGSAELMPKVTQAAGMMSKHKFEAPVAEKLMAAGRESWEHGITLSNT